MEKDRFTFCAETWLRIMVPSRWHHPRTISLPLSNVLTRLWLGDCQYSSTFGPFIRYLSVLYLPFRNSLLVSVPLQHHNHCGQKLRIHHLLDLLLWHFCLSGSVVVRRARTVDGNGTTSYYEEITVKKCAKNQLQSCPWCSWFIIVATKLFNVFWVAYYNEWCVS